MINCRKTWGLFALLCYSIIALILPLSAQAADGNAPVYEKALFLRGSMNDWSTRRELQYQGNSLYVGTETLRPGEYEFKIADDAWTPGTNFGAGETAQLQIDQEVDAVDGSDTNFTLAITAAGAYEFRLNAADRNHPRISVSLAQGSEAKASTSASTTCSSWDGKAITVDVSKAFVDGTELQDSLTGTAATVKDGHVTLQPGERSQGFVLLEPRKTPDLEFNWQNATVYFVITDRFANGNPQNDQSYGRARDGKEEIGTFHGGDLAGLITKLDYLQNLGVNALWITAPYEQIHGWVGGGDGDFQHYAYHGYWALDFTQIDANFGTEAEFRALVEGAHKRGIRVLLDVVMNHPGYATLSDMQAFGFGGLVKDSELSKLERWSDWKPADGQTWHDYHKQIDYQSPAWQHWWGPAWIRAGLGGDYETPPSTDQDPIKGGLNFLPDFKTESSTAVSLPDFLALKDTRATVIEKGAPRDYLISWLTDWVRRYGIDGFRVDTVKHVEPETWQQLKQSASAALAAWKTQNPELSLDKQPFWMVGEVFGHSLNRNNYYDKGFDALINFGFQKQDLATANDCFARQEEAFAAYATELNGKTPYNTLSYISSHDTELFTNRSGGLSNAQQLAAANLLFMPGAVQIYYGDETGRRPGPAGSDAIQGTRSDMNWNDLESGHATPILNFWRQLGQFRKRHPAIGAGQHIRLSEAPYAFARTYKQGDQEDNVVVVYAGRPTP